MAEILIFKAGKYPQGDWPKERLQKMVDAYDPEKGGDAPLVIGHRWYTNSDEGEYAHGWIKSLRMDGAGKVFAEVDDFSAQVKQAMAEKKLRYVSAEIYEHDKTDPTQPPYLRAVALLGRAGPQIPGLRLPSLFSQFAEGTITPLDEKDNVAAFTRRVNADDTQVFKDIPDAGISRPGNHEEVSTMDDTEKLKAELAAKEAELATFKKEVEDLKSARRKQDSLTYFGKLRDEGKLPPAQFEQAAALDARLGEENREAFRALFSNLGQELDLSGKHLADKKRAAAPAASEEDLSAQIRAFQKEKGFASFSDAAEALHAEKPDLFEKAGGEA
jgi:hypothetical protein